MRTVYALQFNLVRNEDRCPEDCLSCLCGQVVDWVQGKYLRAWDQTVDLDFGGTATTPREGHLIRLTREGAYPRELVTAEWNHPDDNDPSLLWSIVLSAARQDAHVQVALSVRVSSARLLIRPADFTTRLGRPRLLTQLIRNCRCTIAGRDIPSEVTVLGIEDVEGFVADTLFASDRALPVVMISPDPWSERPLVRAGELQERLLGLAQVVLLESKWVGFRVTDRVGTHLSCFNGAVRLYWPGLSPSSDPFEHRLYLPDTIRSWQAEGRSLDDRLFRMLAGISAFRVSEGAVIRSARRELEAARAAEVRVLREGIQDGAAEHGEFLDEFERTLRENEQLRQQREDQQLRVLELEEELERLKENMAVVYEYRAREQAAAAKAAEKEGEPEFATVKEAVAQAEQDFQDILVIWESAKEAAEKSRFPRPHDAYRALLAIAEVGREYFASRREKRSMGSWENAFKERGFSYKHTEHQLTRTMHGDDRDFKTKGRRKRMLRHLTIGGASRENCLQIYLESDDDAGRIDIGYCGVHLPHDSQRT